MLLVQMTLANTAPVGVAASRDSHRRLYLA